MAEGAARRVEDLELALDAAYAAGQVIMPYFGADPEVRLKSPDQPVTAADLEADRLLAERLLAARPEYGWLSEETVDSPERLGRSRVWVVDPIDGTRSFIAGYGEFGVSVGLVEDDEAVVGVVYNPAADVVFWATRGGGACRAEDWRGGRQGGTPIRVRESAEGERPSVLASRSEIRRGELAPVEADHRIVPRGSTAFKLAGVAAGAADALLSRGPKREWDIAAGALIVEEAGGVVTDLAGVRRTYNRPDSYIRGLIAGAPGAHGRLLERARGLPPTHARPEAGDMPDD